MPRAEASAVRAINMTAWGRQREFHLCSQIKVEELDLRHTKHPDRMLALSSEHPAGGWGWGEATALFFIFRERDLRPGEAD
jgi:hypothetical protein